ncbi:MAG: hypothetical protein MUO72_05295 [Bacteroidales bacterium]|nr:hypothetical protein [Bacteroidales bacterium]
MKQFLKITVILCSVLLFTGCKKNYVISERQRILFQYEYINNAQANQHYGFIIDNEGNVLTYNNPVEWNFPDKDLIITDSQVDENIGKCIYSGKKIPGEKLLKFSNFIENIASSKVTATKNTGSDAGKTVFICYQFSESIRTYKGSLIKMEGDNTCENLNFYSKKVTSWMREICDSISIK